MFEPETEDMLPRAAPRPCASVPTGHNDEIVKPTVPEVSILFGQPPQQQQQQQQAALVQRPAGSFASWKKQILPRVNFSPVLTTELGPASPPVSTSAGINTTPGCNEYNYLPRSRAFDVDRTSSAQPLIVNSNVGYVHSTYTRDTYPTEVLVSVPRLPNPQSQPQSHNHAHPSAATTDVLTICAGTQTDAETVSSRRDSISAVVGNLADKNDLREILTQLEIMRQEQQQLRRLCESLVQQQHTAPSKTVKETSSQCEILTAKSNATVKRTTPIVQDYIVEEDERSTPYEVVQTRANPQFQSPRAAPPMAQSTGYRCTTPQGKQSPALPPPETNSPVIGTVLPKPSTEKSLVMNELARKYLPQKQINELMDELRLSPATANDVAANAGTNTTPLRQIDNFHQSPSNISNASYVYLKKYRLLPEQRVPYDHHADMMKMHRMQQSESPVSPSPQAHQPMLDLDNIRNQPKLI
ncbi:hypothetical protein ACLKA6_006643 [Drosophila palustris]